MTKFDGSRTVERWLYILEKELPEQLTATTWLKRVNVQVDGRTATWANQTSEVRQILYITINNTTIEDKDAFIQLLYQEFSNDQNNIMIKEQANTELLTLSQKEDKNFYEYYYRTEILLIGISEKDQVTYNEENLIVLNNAKQYILKDTIAKFGFSLKIPKLCLHMIEYRADPMRSLYGLFKKTKAYLHILNAKAQMQKRLELKSDYKAFKSF